MSRIISVGTTTATLIPPIKPGTNDELDDALDVGDADALGTNVVEFSPLPLLSTPGATLGDTLSSPFMVGPVVSEGSIHVDPLSTGRNDAFSTYTVPMSEQDTHRRNRVTV